MEDRDKEIVQIGIKVRRRFRRDIKRYALDHNTTVTQLTVEYWERLLANEPNGPEGEGDE